MTASTEGFANESGGNYGKDANPTTQLGQEMGRSALRKRGCTWAIAKKGAISGFFFWNGSTTLYCHGAWDRAQRKK